MSIVNKLHIEPAALPPRRRTERDGRVANGGKVVIRIDYRGQWLSIPELGRVTGICERTLRDRYHCGDRGERLWRAAEYQRQKARLSRRRPNDEAEFVDPESQQKTRIVRSVRAKSALQASMAAHDSAFAAPLIAADLLSPEERQAIHESVRGRQRWRSGL